MSASDPIKDWLLAWSSDDERLGEERLTALLALLPYRTPVAGLDVRVLARLRGEQRRLPRALFWVLRAALVLATFVVSSSLLWIPAIIFAFLPGAGSIIGLFAATLRLATDWAVVAASIWDFVLRISSKIALVASTPTAQISLAVALVAGAFSLIVLYHLTLPDRSGFNVDTT